MLATPLERVDAERRSSTPTRSRDAATQARARGYATEDGESRPGVRAVAAPVFAVAGDALAALGGRGRPAGGDLDGAGRLVAERAHELSERLGAADG